MKLNSTCQYHEVKLNIEYETFANLTVMYDTTTNLPTTSGTVTGGSIPYSSLYVDYVYLDTDERRRFAQVSHEYLIEQLQFTGEESLTATNNRIRLNFNHPVKELIWVVSAHAPNGDWADYTYAGVNPVQQALLQLNGHDRFSVRQGTYFNLVQPYQHHSNIPTSAGLNVYSFAIKPEEHQPSGTCNFSRIDNATLSLTTNAAPTGAAPTVKIFASNYNVKIDLNALKSYLSGPSEQRSCEKSVKHSHFMLVASRVGCRNKWRSTLQHSLLFGKPLRAFYTKHNFERFVWRRTNSGTVIVRRIGQSACLLPNPCLIGNGRASETEREWVDDDGPVIQNRLKIQSGSYRKIGDTPLPRHVGHG
jgi:hypothetical protein